jgi:hypothetical protein
MDFDALTRAFHKEEALAAWLNKHSHWHTANLETHEVLVIGTFPIVFVHKDHPAIACLRDSHHLIGTNLDDYPLIDGIYLKLSTALFTACCNAIRTQIYSQPTPVKPKALMKLQRWARGMLQQRRNARRLALAMALHERLGVASHMYGIDAELLVRILGC